MAGYMNQPNGIPQQDPRYTPPQVDNMALGTVGALAGSLAGVLCIVLLGRLGIASALSGAVMAVCTLVGYRKLGGALTVRGIAICVAIMLVMIFVGDYIDWAFVVSEQLGYGFFESLGEIPRLLEHGNIESAGYFGNLVRLYLFAAIGAVPTVLSYVRR